MRAENIPLFFKIFQKKQNKQKKWRISGKLDVLLNKFSIYGRICKEELNVKAISGTVCIKTDLIWPLRKCFYFPPVTG